MEELTTTTEAPTNGASVLTEETYNTLEKMLKSNDEADHKMAQLILNQVDIPKSIWWIYLLSRYYTNRMVNLRTKASRQFRDDSRLFNIACMNKARFVRFCRDKDWLTPEIYNNCKKDTENEIKNCIQSPFHEVIIMLKPEYAHLVEKNEPIKIK